MRACWRGVGRNDRRRRDEDPRQRQSHPEPRLARAGARDARRGRPGRCAEDARFGERRGDELPPELPRSQPAGKVNVTDPDSQLVKSLHGWVQGYTAQAAATPEQIIVAADVITSGNERNRLEPMVDQAPHELAAAGVAETPQIVLADAGFYNLGQIDRLRRRGMRALVSPDASGRHQPGVTRRNPAYQQMREELVSDDGYELYRRRAQIIEPVFAHPRIPRRTDRF